jgi:hypothetical protein
LRNILEQLAGLAIVIVLLAGLWLFVSWSLDSGYGACPGEGRGCGQRW